MHFVYQQHGEMDPSVTSFAVLSRGEFGSKMRGVDKSAGVHAPADSPIASLLGLFEIGWEGATARGKASGVFVPEWGYPAPPKLLPAKPPKWAPGPSLPVRSR